MPYVLSPMIGLGFPGMWFEGSAYEKKSIYSIRPGKLPPVNYDEHTIRSHSLTHIETPAHTIENGRRLESYFGQNQTHFYGLTVVLRLAGNKYEAKGNGVFHWEVSLDDIQSRLKHLEITSFSKVLITSDFYPTNEQGFHDPNYVLTLSQEAASFLTSLPTFNLYGTSWKSSDYKPGSAERPIHNTIFEKGLILENLNLEDVPEGIYFMTAFPLPFIDASESPVVPVLFTRKEISNIF